MNLIAIYDDVFLIIFKLGFIFATRECRENKWLNIELAVNGFSFELQPIRAGLEFYAVLFYFCVVLTVFYGQDIFLERDSAADSVGGRYSPMLRKRTVETKRADGVARITIEANTVSLKNCFHFILSKHSSDWLILAVKSIVVEEFVQGTNHGFSAMLVKGKVAFAFADNEQYYINKYMVSGANSPSTSGSETLAKLRDYSERIARELKLVDGILHIQYIERPDGTPVIIEICRRPPGDLYIKFVQYATGIDYPKFIVMAETGMDISAIPDIPTQGFWLRHCVMASTQAGERTATGDTCEGIVRDVAFAPEIQGNIVEKFLWYKPGEVITDKLTYKAGIVFFKFESLAEMEAKTARMTDLVKVVTGP